MNTIDDQIIQLAQARARLADAKTRKAAMLATITESEEYKALAYEIEQAQVVENAADAQVREAAISAWSATANKKPHAAASIQMKTVLKYNVDVALKWAREHLLEAVTLDRKLFEAHVKAVSKTQPVPCVTIYQEASAMIASDLSEYLPTPQGDPEEAEFESMQSEELSHD